MLNFRTNLRIVAAIVACLAVTTMFASCDKDKVGDGGDGNNPSGIVGKWFCDYGMIHTSVYFFDKDGTFIMASIYKYNVSSMDAVWHCKGKYQVNDETLDFTDMYIYENDLAGWRDVPMNEIDGNALAQRVLDIQKIMKTGTRAEVEKLINPDNPYYYQKANKGWRDFGERTGEIEFTDKNHMKTNIFGSMNAYERVK